MIGAMLGIAVMAGLFVLFGLSSRGPRRGKSCGVCTSECAKCVEGTTKSSLEVNRVRK